VNIDAATSSDLPSDSEAGFNTHLFLGLCVVSCLAFFGWASVATLDIVSMANGEVIPSSQVKNVQHLEGGIVREISIAEGDYVKQGQQLIVLESMQTGADVGEIQVRLLSLRAEIARLEAEVSGAEAPTFGSDLIANSPRMVKQTLVRFYSRKKSQQNRIASQAQAIVQRSQEINEINARIRNQRNSLKLMEEQIAISDELLKEDLTNRYNHLDLLKEASNIRGRIEEDASAIKRAKSALKEAESNMEGIHTSFMEEAGKELEDARLSFNELSQREQKFEDNLARTILRSPVDGVIKTLHVTSVGGVLRPGEVVVDVVPVDDRLIIEAQLPTQDIGYVQAGQEVMIKLTSSDAQRFGGLAGTVTTVSPDTLVTDEGRPYYKVRIETVSDRFQHGALQYRLFPGMQVIASIHTGERTVLEYIGGPFVNSMSGAMSER